MKSRIYIISIFFIMLCLFFPLFNYSALASDTKEDVYILFDKEIPNTAKQKITKEFPSISWKEIPEINFVELSNVDSNELVIEFVKGQFQIDDIGTGLKIEPPPSTMIMDMNLLSAPIRKYSTAGFANTYSDWSWNIQKVTQNYKSYTLEKGNHEVKVGIIDSGIDFTHPDLRDNIVGKGKSFVPGNPSVQDMLGHGTMVAGVIAANGKLTGVGPEIGIVPYKVFDTDGADSSWVIQAIIQATKDNMDVINLSLNTYKSLKNKNDKVVINAYKKAIQYANRNNTVVVSAAGNDGLDIFNKKNLADSLGESKDLQLMLPGGIDSSITVGASTKDDTIASYSNYGKNVDIFAPGGSYGPLWEESQIADIGYYVLNTYPTYLPQSPINAYLGIDDGYAFSLGTSLAAPKVAATAALIIAEYKEKHNKRPNVAQIEKILYGNKGNNKSEILDTYEVLKKIR